MFEKIYLPLINLLKLSDELINCMKIAFEAGETIMKYYNSGFKSWRKTDKSIVTEADMAANELLRNYFTQKYNVPILSEETTDDHSRLNHPQFWIIDPIDGTEHFNNQTGEFTVLIGLIKNGRPYLGIVYKPIDKTFYFAEKNKGAYCLKNQLLPRSLRVSNRSKFDEIQFVCSGNCYQQDVISVARNLNINNITTVGGTGLRIMEIAQSNHDLYIQSNNHGPKIWDVAAPEIIIKEAGGYISDLLGNEISYTSKDPKLNNGLLVCNHQLEHYQKLFKPYLSTLLNN